MAQLIWAQLIWTPSLLKYNFLPDTCTSLIFAPAYCGVNKMNWEIESECVVYKHMRKHISGLYATCMYSVHVHVVEHLG